MSESERNTGKTVIVRARTKLEKERWQWLARRRGVPLTKLIRDMLARDWLTERDQKQGAA